MEQEELVVRQDQVRHLEQQVRVALLVLAVQLAPVVHLVQQGLAERQALEELVVLVARQEQQVLLELLERQELL
jgi:hypothetical protein